MCFACEGFDAAQLDVSPALASRARRIEATMPGRPVPELAWRILLGQEQGSIPWPVMHRLMICLDKAENALCARLRCEAVTA
jgi:hypothetical protein